MFYWNCSYHLFLYFLHFFIHFFLHLQMWCHIFLSNEFQLNNFSIDFSLCFLWWIRNSKTKFELFQIKCMDHWTIDIRYIHQWSHINRNFIKKSHQNEAKIRCYQGESSAHNSSVWKLVSFFFSHSLYNISFCKLNNTTAIHTTKWIEVLNKTKSWCSYWFCRYQKYLTHFCYKTVNALCDALEFICTNIE